MIKYVGVVCGDDLEIDNNKKEAKIYIKGKLVSIIDFYKITQIGANYYYVFI